MLFPIQSELLSKSSEIYFFGSKIIIKDPLKFDLRFRFSVLFYQPFIFEKQTNLALFEATSHAQATLIQFDNRENVQQTIFLPLFVIHNQNYQVTCTKI